MKRKFYGKLVTCSDCGKVRQVRSDSSPIRCQSCASSVNNIRHGHASSCTHTYISWQTMKRRCSEPTFHSYRYYGGRGIKVCRRWLTFDNFLADMGERPGANYSLDRVDSAKDYAPGNCRWLTKSENSRRARYEQHHGKQAA